MFPLKTAAPSASSTVQRLWFIRHGETDANANHVLQGGGIDPPLSDKGISQAQRLRDRLSTETFDLIISSSMQRAVQTADIVAEKHLQVPRESYDALKELGWGQWEGTDVRHNNLTNLIKDWNNGDFLASAPDGESPLQVEKRAVSLIYKILSRPFKDIALVLHGRLLRVILSSLLHQDLFHMASFTHHNTTINIVDVITETKDLEATAEKVAQIRSLLQLPQTPVVLDDNCNVTTSELSLTSSHSRPEHVPRTNVDHPENVYFIPVCFDSYQHLLPDLL